MARLAPSPQDVVEHVRRLLALPHPPRQARPTAATSVERIVDAALAVFSEQGVRATTMTRIAKEAGVSREWLYRQFPNRDAVVVAVVQRELARFVDGLAARPLAADLDTALTDTFVFAVEFLRDHALLQRVLQSEPDVVTGRAVSGARGMVGLAVEAGAGYIHVLGGVPVDEATVVAETLVRLVASITLAPQGALDLHDPDQLRRYAESVVPAVIAAARPAPPVRSRRTR